MPRIYVGSDPAHAVDLCAGCWERFVTLDDPDELALMLDLDREDCFDAVSAILSDDDLAVCGDDRPDYDDEETYRCENCNRILCDGRD